MIVTNPFSPGSLTRETINTVASGWWVLLLSGGAVPPAGAIPPGAFRPSWGLMLSYGIIEALFAFGLIPRPDVPLVATVLAIGLWTMVSGVVQVTPSFELKTLPRRLGTAAS